MLQFGEGAEVIDRLGIVPRFVIPQSRQYADTGLPPGGGFQLPIIPVLVHRAFADQVAVDDYEAGLFAGDFGDDGAPIVRVAPVRGLGVGGAQIAIGDELKRIRDRESAEGIVGRRARGLLRRRRHAGEQADQEGKGDSAGTRVWHFS